VPITSVQSLSGRHAGAETSISKPQLALDVQFRGVFMAVF